MKTYLNPNFIAGFVWFCVLQPALFLFGVGIFVHGIFQLIWG